MHSKSWILIVPCGSFPELSNAFTFIAHDAHICVWNVAFSMMMRTIPINTSQRPRSWINVPEFRIIKMYFKYVSKWIRFSKKKRMPSDSFNVLDTRWLSIVCGVVKKQNKTNIHCDQVENFNIEKHFHFTRGNKLWFILRELFHQQRLWNCNILFFFLKMKKIIIIILSISYLLFDYRLFTWLHRWHSISIDIFVLENALISKSLCLNNHF